MQVGSEKSQRPAKLDADIGDELSAFARSRGLQQQYVLSAAAFVYLAFPNAVREAIGVAYATWKTTHRGGSWGEQGAATRTMRCIIEAGLREDRERDAPPDLSETMARELASPSGRARSRAEADADADAAEAASKAAKDRRRRGKQAG